MMKKISKSLLSMLFCILFIFAGCSQIADNKTTNPPSEKTTVADKAEKDTPASNPKAEVEISDEVIELVEDTEEKVESGEDIATDKIPDSDINEETGIYDEGALENDATVEQGEISYDGTNTGKGSKLLSGAPAITYYSQADSRWGYIMYSNHGDKSQTIRSSGCGPTSAAMVVSASKGIIIPPTMAKLFNDNGFRSSNNGTYWSAWPFLADFFDFNDYQNTSSYSKMISLLKQDKNKDGVADYFVVVSCGYGLFTTGGHYIVLMGFKDGKIIVYDPYYYWGKFNTASRKAAGVIVSGNIAYVSEASFKKYANYQNFWAYSNDAPTAKTTDTTTTDKKPDTAVKSDITKVNYVRYVATQHSPLNVRNAPDGAIIGTLNRGTKVTVTGVKGSWSRINTSTYKGKWVSSTYLSAVKVKKSDDKCLKYVKTRGANLNVCSGPGTNYKIVSYRKNGAKVTQYLVKNGWSKISDTKNEWVSSNYLTPAA